MRCLILFATIFFIAACAGSEPIEKSVTIPLKDIWAFRMPGTRAMNDSRDSRNGDFLSPEGRMVAEIRHELIGPPEDKPRPGFAVVGAGLDALRKAHAVLVKNKELKKEFSTNNDISLVFFSYSSGSFVHLKNIKRDGATIQINYEFVPHQTTQVSEHIALIPLGKLPEGKYSVEIVQLPLDPKYERDGFQPTDKEYAETVICRPFSFVVSRNSH